MKLLIFVVLVSNVLFGLIGDPQKGLLMYSVVPYYNKYLGLIFNKRLTWTDNTSATRLRTI